MIANVRAKPRCCERKENKKTADVLSAPPLGHHVACNVVILPLLTFHHDDESIRGIGDYFA